MHAPVDRLGGEGVAQLVGVDVADAGRLGQLVDPAGDQVALEGTAVVGDEQAGAVVVVVGLPGRNELDQAGVQRHVTVIAQFAHRDPQPPRPRTPADSVFGQGAQLAHAHTGAGQDLDAQLAAPVGVGGGRREKASRSGVVESLGQRTGHLGEVGAEQRRKAGGIWPAPLDHRSKNTRSKLRCIRSVLALSGVPQGVSLAAK